jgi:Ca2+-transporting ATPase
MRTGMSEQLTRSMVFMTLIFSNVFLTLVNRSFHYSVLTTIRYKNNLLAGMVAVVLVLLAAMLYVPFLNTFFQLAHVNLLQIGVCLLTALLSVVGFEVYKWWKRRGDSYGQWKLLCF